MLTTFTNNRLFRNTNWLSNHCGNNSHSEILIQLKLNIEANMKYFGLFFGSIKFLVAKTENLKIDFDHKRTYPCPLKNVFLI